MNPGTERWLSFANADIKTASKLFEDRDLAGIICFHCQQAIEKGLKAVLHEYNVAIPKTHSLVKLFNLVPPEVKDKFPVNEYDLIPVDKVYIDSRYPIDMGLLPFGMPDIDDAGSIYAVAQNVLDIIKAGLNK